MIDKPIPLLFECAACGERMEVFYNKPSGSSVSKGFLVVPCVRCTKTAERLYKIEQLIINKFEEQSKWLSTVLQGT